LQTQSPESKPQSYQKQKKWQGKEKKEGNYELEKIQDLLSIAQ
jgi:hypothetical protein